MSKKQFLRLTLKITGKVLYFLILAFCVVFIEFVKLASNREDWEERIERMRELQTYGMTEILPTDGTARSWQG